MATLAFSVAGQFAGGLIGGPLGATLGRAVGALAGSVVDNALFGESGAETAGRDIRVQTASEGRAVPRIYGWNRVSGNIIWATELERIVGQDVGAKGVSAGADTGEEIAANFAVAFCEGEVSHLGRIWVDGELLDTEGLNMRFYSGSEDQLADSLISAKQGADATPAFRGICYMVFEQLPLSPFGNRIPNISAELCRATGDLERSIKAITVIPGATEFGYDPIPRVRIVSPGVAETENAHVLSQTSNWTLSIDELQNLCPNLAHVALVVSWFGDDLRLGACNVQPRVETDNREIKDTEWKVSGLQRGDVPVVSQHDGGPAYGGTPSDSAVIAAISDLNARGIKVTLYPLIMMDVPDDNTLVDPYSQAVGQPPYPWRGRITCSPSPGQVGTPDNSSAIDAPMLAFVGNAVVDDFTASEATVTYSGPIDWGYRRMILHYAYLAEIAGGIDTMLIGSEMRGMTQLRRAPDEFPFVDALVSLAQDVRTIVGDSTNISYAADWSEYSGYQPPEAPGDKFFHLDPLWAHTAIDAVGIDNYMPLSDWRDGSAHADAYIANSIYELDYLQGNIAGGEGYDWYYASDADRLTGARSVISDGAYDEPWVWRYKDLSNWWSNSHYNRIGGVRASEPTGWVPQSKPFWFTELGCGAVDKGPNLPSAFTDPKSSENTRPHFSNGQTDTQVQRQFLRAHHKWWQPETPSFDERNNPTSSIYGGRMVDPERLYLWTWDARPYPAFPNLQDVWADAPNYVNGHWLTGRLGVSSLAEMIMYMAADYGVEIEASFAEGMKVQGLQIDAIVSMRDAIASLLEVADLTVVDRPNGLAIVQIGASVSAAFNEDACVDIGDVITSRRRPDASAFIGQLALSYLDRQHAYQAGTVTAFALEGAGGANVHSGLVIDPDVARKAVERVLENAIVAEDQLEFSLPPSSMDLDVGDVIELDDQSDGPFVISELRNGNHLRVTAKALSGRRTFAITATERFDSHVAAPATGTPLVIGAHLPPLENETASRLVLGAYAKPWLGDILVEDVVTGIEATRLSQSAYVGAVTTSLAPISGELWDRASSLEVALSNGHLSSLSQNAVLSGANRAAVQRDDGSWEILGFATADLITESNYKLSNLLRGLQGTADPFASISAGRKFMLLDDRCSTLSVSTEKLGGSVVLRAFVGLGDAIGQEQAFPIALDAVRPLAPAHLQAVRQHDDEIAFDWVRRARRAGNSWVLNEVPLEPSPEKYRLSIFDGATLMRSIETETASATYTAVSQIADFGALPSTFNFSLTQTSPTYGTGSAATGEFHD